MDAWQDGAVDGWDGFQAGDFAYTLANSCDPISTTLGLTPQAVSEDLGAESDEQDTFLPYTPIVFADFAPTAAAGADGSGCMLTYSLDGPGGDFVRPPTDRGLL